MTMSRIGRAVATMLALGLGLGAAPPASANSAGDTTLGGCSFALDPRPLVTGGQNGVIADASATTDASGRPTAATVSCWIEVNGIEAPGTRLDAAGPGVEVGANEISFAAWSWDYVALCEAVTYADGSAELPSCHTATNREPPWACGSDIWTDCLFQYVDTVVCPELVAHAGTYGPVTIGPDGDVYVPDPLGLGLSPFYDCPPYNFY